MAYCIGWTVLDYLHGHDDTVRSSRGHKHLCRKDYEETTPICLVTSLWLDEVKSSLESILVGKTSWGYGRNKGIQPTRCADLRERSELSID